MGFRVRKRRRPRPGGPSTWSGSYRNLPTCLLAGDSTESAIPNCKKGSLMNFENKQLELPLAVWTLKKKQERMASRIGLALLNVLSPNRSNAYRWIQMTVTSFFSFVSSYWEIFFNPTTVFLFTLMFDKFGNHARFSFFLFWQIHSIDS